jgi:transcription termination factor Rho
LLVSKDRDGSDAADDAARNEIYEAAKRTDNQIPRLQALPMRELIELAEGEGVTAPSGCSKQELIFALLEHRVKSAGLGWGEGVLDVLPDGFGFLRSKRYSYTPGIDDIYVSPSQIRRLHLRPGHVLAGPVRPPKEGEHYFALLRVEAVNGRSVERLRHAIAFDDLTPLLPRERLRLEHPGCGADIRLIDLLAPIGKGQRVLVLSPPNSGRTRLLTNLAKAILVNHDAVYVMLLLVDERPEEVTEMLANTGPDERREVAASTFDEPAARHIALAELVLAKARRLVESGRDVVILLDSLTQLVRAYNVERPHSGKVISAGLDAAALQMPKRLFGSARCLEEGGSLTIIATALTDADSRINDAIVDEFKGKANCEIVLDRELANLHVYPALDVARTGTRREDTMLSNEELDKLRRLRKKLRTGDALEELLEMIGRTKDNAGLMAEL